MQPPVSADRMCLEGQDLLSLGARGMRAIRGRRIGMVVQDPKQGLDPLMTIGSQLVEMLRLHRKGTCRGRLQPGARPAGRGPHPGPEARHGPVPPWGLDEHGTAPCWP